MPKFFTDSRLITPTKLSIVGEDAQHIARVLRMKAGDELTVCDGCGTDYQVRISSVDKNQVEADILHSTPCQAEPRTEIVLFQALPKQGKMETIIQKNTELGIGKIVPVYTKRCVVKPTDKLERWNKVALEAAKQCGRGVVPQVMPTLSLDQALAQMQQYACRLMPYELEREHTLKQALTTMFPSIAILIGPEGGFEEAEVQQARQAGVQTITLGKRILRTETASAAVVPILLYQQDDM